NRSGSTLTMSGTLATTRVADNLTTLALDPFQSTEASAIVGFYQSGGSANGSAFTLSYDRGLLQQQTTYFGTVGLFVSDPVSPVSGEFYVDTVDLTLPGPMPLEMRRNYSSQNLSDNEFGHG